jgi:hypothetical protein
MQAGTLLMTPVEDTRKWGKKRVSRAALPTLRFSLETVALRSPS